MPGRPAARQSPATYWLPSTAMTITIDMLIETVRCLMPLLISFILLILTLLSMWLHVVQNAGRQAFVTPIKAMGRRQCLPFSWTTLTKPSLKIGSVNKAFLFCYWQQLRKNIFFRNKTFLFFKVESWNFQHLFEKEFRETSQNFNSFSSFRQFLFPFF